MPRRNTKLMRCFAGELEQRRSALIAEFEHGSTVAGQIEIAKIERAIAARAPEVIEYLQAVAAVAREKAVLFAAAGNEEAAAGWRRSVARRERRIGEIEAARPEVARTMGEFRLPTAA